MKKDGIILVVICCLSFVQSFAQKQEWNADTIMKRMHRVEMTWTSCQVNMEMTTMKKKVVTKSEEFTLSWQKGKLNMSTYDSLGKLTFQ